MVVNMMIAILRDTIQGRFKWIATKKTIFYGVWQSQHFNFISICLNLTLFSLNLLCWGLKSLYDELFGKHIDLLTDPFYHHHSGAVISF
jgi:hypothetical protein